MLNFRQYDLHGLTVEVGCRDPATLVEVERVLDYLGLASLKKPAAKVDVQFRFLRQRPNQRPAAAQEVAHHDGMQAWRSGDTFYFSDRTV